MINNRHTSSKVNINLIKSISEIVTTDKTLTFTKSSSPKLVVLYPSSGLSKKTLEYLNQKPDTALTRAASSSPSKVIMISVAAIGIVGSAAGACSLGFMNIGSALIKLFIIIELIGKFLHLPIWYKGALLETLYSLS